MSYLIIQSICITTIIATTLAATIKYETKSKKQPDIEDFISRLLASDKFEKLADKIAEKAADRIFTLQKESSQNGPKMADAKKADALKPRSVTSREIKQDEKHIEDLSKENPDEISSNINKTNNFTNEKKDVDESEQDKLKDKSKIDTIAAIHKFSEFRSADLSLNYKHFTTQEKTETTSATSLATETKSKKHHKSSHKKKSHKNNDAEKGNLSKRHKNKPKNKTDDSDLSIDERNESEESKKRKNFEKHTEVVKSNEKVELDREHSESTSSQSDESNSGSNENKYTTTALPVLRTNKNNAKDNIIKDIFSAETDEKSESETNELNMPDFLSKVTASTVTQAQQVTKSIVTIASGHADAEKSSQESKSSENKVSNIVEAAKLDDELDHIADAKIDKNSTDQKGDSNKIDIKHKIREQNGKFYAFAESSDYDEYHEKLKKILQSVKDKRSSKRKMINKELLDLIEK